MSWRDKESALNLWIDLMLILFLLHQLKNGAKHIHIIHKNGAKYNINN